MKRVMPSSLITFLQSQAGRGCFRAHLYAITLPTGAVIYATDGQLHITVPSGTPGWAGSTQTFKAATYGVWKRGPITSEASFSPNAGTMSLTLNVQPSTVYPNTTVGMLQAAIKGFFDGATVAVYTAYMSAYGDVSLGIETKFIGTITKVTRVDRVSVEFECADPLYLLNMKVPAQPFKAGCPWSFADSNCTLTASDYTVAFTAHSGSTQLVLTPVSAFSQADGYFTQGVVTCTAGANAGFSQSVKSHVSGALTLMAPFILPVTAGDTFSVIRGCARTQTACAGTLKANGTPINNLSNYGGTDYVPVPTSAI